MTDRDALKVVTIDSVAQTTGLSHAQVVNILELIGDKPEWEEMTERRITYGYGVNSDQRYSGFYGSFEQMREHVEQVTQGGVDVTRREQRTVAYGPWEPVE